MAKITVIFAVLLILLGVVGYLGDTSSVAENGDVTAAKRSWTALIPAFAGVPLLLFGLLAFKENMRMHAMHGAVLIGLIGAILAGGRTAMSLVKLASAPDEVNQRGLIFVSIMTVLCGVFVFLCVRSFIDARRRRREAEAA